LNADRHIEGSAGKAKVDRVHLRETERFGVLQEVLSHTQTRKGSVDADGHSHSGKEAAQDPAVSAAEFQDDHGGGCLLENEVDFGFEIGLDSRRSKIVAGAQALGSEVFRVVVLRHERRTSLISYGDSTISVARPSNAMSLPSAFPSVPEGNAPVEMTVLGSYNN